MRKVGVWNESCRASSRVQAFVLAAVERHAIGLHSILIALFILTAGLAALFFTVEGDESWMLMSTLHAFGIRLQLTSALSNPTITTGGAHLLIHGVLAWITQGILIHRLVSVFFSVALIWMVYRILKYLEISRDFAAAGAALFTAVPGFLLQSSLATGEIISTTFLVGASFHFVRFGRFNTRDACVSGVLLGIACATRISVAFALAAPPLFVVITSNDIKREAISAGVAVLTAFFTAAASVGLYLVASHAASAHEQLPYLAQATGVGSSQPKIGRYLQYATIANRIVPSLLIIGTLASCYIFAGRPRYSKATPICAIFLITGVLGWISWTLVAPIPHLRYLWPSVVCFWLAGIVQLVTFATNSLDPKFKIAAHAVVAAACFYALATDILLIAQGESLLLVYQAIDGSPLVLSGQKFTAARDQLALARFMQSQPDEAKFFSIFEPATYPITYLSHRVISSVEHMQPSDKNFVILVPAQYSIWRLSPEFSCWRRANAVTVFSRGGFVALRVRPNSSGAPSRFSGAGDYDHL